MKWINFVGGGRARIRPFAGLYLRTPRRTRFWGWGEPPISAAFSAPAAPAAANNDRPWAALGDWLRAAHAMFGSEDAGVSEAVSLHASDAGRGAWERSVAQGAPSFASPEPLDTAQTLGRSKRREEKRRLRFVCNRHVIGFVFD